MRAIFPNGIYHIYSRGTLKMDIFRCSSDYERFLSRMAYYKKKFHIPYRAFCLMPNHIHFLLAELNWPPDQKFARISKFMQGLLTSHGKFFCKKYGHSGHVFQGVYRSKLIDSQSYYDQIVKYIHENPVRAGLVSRPEDWPYSSLTRNLL